MKFRMGLDVKKKKRKRKSSPDYSVHRQQLTRQTTQRRGQGKQWKNKVDHIKKRRPEETRKRENKLGKALHLEKT